MIVPFPPGGSVDVVGRALTPKLSERLGQQVVIENRSGASGTIGTEAVARARPDGYTVLLNTIPFVTNSYLYKEVPYDPFTDFLPVSWLCSSPGTLVVNPSVPARSVRELLQLAKAKPGALNYSAAGAGTNPTSPGSCSTTWETSTSSPSSTRAGAVAPRGAGRRSRDHVSEHLGSHPACQSRKAGRARGGLAPSARQRCPRCRPSPRPGCPDTSS
mgnify:CR=1 FL=1